MPNWVYNSITIEGETKKIDALLEHLKPHMEEGLQMSHFEKEEYPQTFLDYDTTNRPDGKGLENPEEIEAYKEATRFQKEKYGCVGWYTYNCNHFGCKWDMKVDWE